jgi:hypothetical protein
MQIFILPPEYCFSGREGMSPPVRPPVTRRCPGGVHDPGELGVRDDPHEGIGQGLRVEIPEDLLPDSISQEIFDPFDMLAVLVKNAVTQLLQTLRSKSAFMTDQQTVEVNMVLNVGEVGDYEGTNHAIDGRLPTYGSHDFVVHHPDLLRHHDGVEILFPAEEMIKTPGRKA